MEKSMANKLTTNVSEPNAQAKIYKHFLELLTRQEGVAMRPIIFLCIGSDRYTGDSLGPLIGSHLLEKTDYTVYGSLDHPVHAGNLVENVNLICRQYHHPIIVAVDACLGKVSEIGNVEIWEGGLEAGIAVGNRLPCIGHISIIGVVNAGSHIGYLDLQSTPLSMVMKLSRLIGGALVDVHETISTKYTGVSRMG